MTSELVFPIRVLHIVGSMGKGGIQSFLMNFYRHVNREKIQFDFLIHIQSEKGYEDEIRDLGGKIYNQNMPSMRSLAGYIKEINRFLEEHKEYQIIHIHLRTVAALWTFVARKKKRISIAHSHNTSNGSGKKALIKDLIQLPIRYQADFMFACSHEAGEWLFGKKATRSDRFRVIPNAIDAKRFAFDPVKREKTRCELRLQNSFVLGHVGRMTEQKNHMFLLLVFKGVREQQNNAKLLLVGDGELMEKIKLEARRLGVMEDVLFMGAKSNTYDYYQAMDVFAFPSLYEGLGISVIEAQANGLPCVVSDKVPKSADIGTDLFISMDLSSGAEEWVKKILEVYNVPRKDYSKSVVRAGFDIENNAEWIREFYENLSHTRG